MTSTHKKYVADKRLADLKQMTSIECQCERCRDACYHKPGWFAPGEAERVADYLKLPLQELFDTKLMVDWLTAGEDTVGTAPVFILSPAVTRSSPGGEFDANPRGRCVFYVDDKCSIHAVKPMECRLWSCQVDGVVHKEVGQTWERPDHQQQIETLLGRKPVEDDSMYGSGFFGGMFD